MILQVSMSMLEEPQLMLMVYTCRQEGAGRHVPTGGATTHAYGELVNYQQHPNQQSLCAL